jgi:hypothetical protein
VNCVVTTRLKPQPVESSFRQAQLSSEEIEARPLRGTTSASGTLSPWLTLTAAGHRIVKPVLAPDNYKPDYAAREGLNTGGLNGAYFVTVLERHSDGMLLIENRHDIGKIKVPKVKMVIEDRFVYPLIRGRGIRSQKHVLSSVGRFGFPSRCLFVS